MVKRNIALGTTGPRRTLRAATLALFAVCGAATSVGQAGDPMGLTPGKAQPAGQAQPGVRNPLDQGASLDGKVKVDDNQIVDLHVNEENLTNVLQMLSIQSQKNIIPSKNVSATVTANLYGVTFYEALDAILNVNGFGYLERGNFIYVYTLDELKAIEEAQRQRVSRVVNLNYLSAADAAEFVKALLSEGGQIKTNGKTENFPSLGDTPVNNNTFASYETMVVYDFEENVEEIMDLVKQLDVKPVQILVEATILQSQLNESNAFGVDFSLIADLDFSNFVNLGGPLRGVDGLIAGSGSAAGGTGGGTGGGGSGGTPLPADGRGAAVGSTAGNTAGPATFKAGIVWNDVAAFLRLLDEVSDTTILSRPNILMLNRQPARVLVGRKVGYLNTTSTDTATTQTVEFLDTGTQLHIRPFADPDGTIRMELKPQVSEAVIRTVTDAGGAAVTIPDEITNELTTNVSVRDGQTIVLGGLFRESTQASRRQVPGLGELPLIGLAFKGHEDETNRSEIIFMIQPTIVADTTLMEQASRAKGFVEHSVMGAREGLLPWSRQKRTGQLLVRAEELAAAGKTEAALNRVRRALALHHVQPDAIALRERLLSDPTVWPDRSMLSEIMHGEMQAKMNAIPVSFSTPSFSPVDSSLQNMETQASVPETTGAEESPVVEPTPEPAMEPIDPSLTEPSSIEPTLPPAEIEPVLPPAQDTPAQPTGDEPGATPPVDPGTPWYLQPSTPSPDEPADDDAPSEEPPIGMGVPGNPFGVTAAFTMREFGTLLAGFTGPAASTYRIATGL
ncbi:MAG: hypothetical protein IT437_14270 [Phycisphaerales bacterium]|nr:hypothetical protein [Phycisphaerales bacterium]